VVDDDAAATDSLIEILTEEGYPVATAKNGKETLKHLRGATVPRLMILDLFMPRWMDRNFGARKSRIRNCATSRRRYDRCERIRRHR